MPEFSGVTPLLARTNMLGKTEPLLLVEDVRTYGLIAKHPPVDLPDITFRFFWSTRLSQDPGSKWLRSVVISAYETMHDKSMRLGRIGG